MGLAPSAAGGPSPSTPPRTPPPTPDWAAPSLTPGALQKEPGGVGGEEGGRGRGEKGFGLREGSSNCNGGWGGEPQTPVGARPTSGGSQLKYVLMVQDKFDHDKGQIHLQFRGAVSTGFFALFLSSIYVREGPSYGSRRYGSAFFGPNEIWPFSLALSPSISGKIKERTRFVNVKIAGLKIAKPDQWEPEFDLFLARVWAPYCAIPRDYLSDTPYCALWGCWCLNMANWVRYPLPLFWAFHPWRACEVEVRYTPPPPKGVSQWYLRDTLWKQGKWVRDPPLRYYLERVLRDRGEYLALGCQGADRPAPNLVRSKSSQGTLQVRVDNLFGTNICIAWILLVAARMLTETFLPSADLCRKKQGIQHTYNIYCCLRSTDT